MRLFIPNEPPDLIRLNVKKQGFATEHLAFTGTTLNDCINEIRVILLDKNINPIAEGKRCTVEFRESNKGINGTTKSFAIYNVTPKQVIEFITEKIK